MYVDMLTKPWVTPVFFFCLSVSCCHAREPDRSVLYDGRHTTAVALSAATTSPQCFGWCSWLALCNDLPCICDVHFMVPI